MLASVGHPVPWFTPENGFQCFGEFALVHW
jgi:hypothetical protein